MAERQKLYMSDMFFQNPAKGDWTGRPTRSRLIQMTPDGKWRVLLHGLQTNGTIASGDGRLLVCDMFGHRVIEVDAETGKILRTVLDRVAKSPIDGPNDMVMDAKGGIYVTDPQFTPEAKKSQPGTQVYYLAPDKTARVVIPAGDMRCQTAWRCLRMARRSTSTIHGQTRGEFRVGLRYSL